MMWAGLARGELLGRKTAGLCRPAPTLSIEWAQRRSKEVFLGLKTDFRDKQKRAWMAMAVLRSQRAYTNERPQLNSLPDMAEFGEL
jgi:hypothetical protein